MGPLQFDMSGSPGDGPRSLTSALHERLRADILAARLLPAQKLHIAGLAKQFSVSLAAVREALSRLVADGLVQASDQRGFRVSPVSPADLRDVTQTRIDIEGLALRRSIERGDQEWLSSVERSFTALCAVPYTYPDDRIDIKSGNGRDGAVKYTDYAIGQFLEQARQKPWFDNTI